MNLLKKIGNVLLTATGVLTGYGPLIGTLIPGDKDDKIMATALDKLDLAANTIVRVEGFGQAIKLPGADKARAAAPEVFQILLNLKLVAGKKPKDVEGAKAAAQRLGGDLADFLNCFED